VEADRQAAGEMMAISSIEISKQGAQATGAIVASAGAGNLARTGSITKREDTIAQSVNLNMAKVRLQYEDAIRGLATRAASDSANETKTEFQKNAGLSDASALKSEADWLNTWGVGLTVASGIVQIGTGLVKSGAFSGTDSGGSTDTTSETAKTNVVSGDPYSLGLSSAIRNSPWAGQF
jgi:hypothetical protein